MKVFRFATLAALSLLLPLFLSPAGANASTLATGTGSFTGTVEITSITQVGGNTIVEGIEVVHLTGFFTGTRIASGNQIIHADGTSQAHDSGTFTGTVDGRAGTVELPHVFWTGNQRLIHAAACSFRYSSMTSCGVR